MLELVLYALLVLAAAGLLLRRRRFAGRAPLAAAAVVAAGALGLLLWSPRLPTRAELAAPARSTAQGFVSSDTCRSCHPAQYESWHRSYHRTMTQLASRETLLPPFEAVQLESRGLPFEVEPRGEELWVRYVDDSALKQTLERGAPPPRESLPLRSGPIVMATGSHHMQIHWVKDREGVFRQVPWIWFEREKRWVPTESVYLQHPSFTLGVGLRWNDNCINCHATGGEPRLRPFGQDLIDTRAGELGIACEACHGPGERHVRANRSPLRRYASSLGFEVEPTIVNPATLPHPRGSEVCAHCHSDRVYRAWDPNVGTAYRPGEPLDRFFRRRRFEEVPEQRGGQPFRASFFWPDGTTRVTGREFSGLAASRCTTHGEMSCTSCHSMHESEPDDQLRAAAQGDGACLECHADYAENAEAHTHHPAGSSGAACVNCHMPNTTYGLLSITRSHQVDSPRARSGARGGRPDACSLCHVDRPLAWTAQWLETWYGQPAPALAPEERSIPHVPLLLLRGDAVQRATAAWHLGWAPARAAAGGGSWAAPFLARALDDPYAAVRYLAGASLRALPGFEGFTSDFVPPQGEHAAEVETALARWRSLAGREALPEAARVLFEAGNAADGELLRRLVAARDDRPLLINE